MIHSISGTISGQHGHILYLDQHGIEWALEVSQHTLQQLALQEGRVKVYTYLHHNQDTMLLFGFSSEEERDLFFELIKISGIGPKQAQRILSGLAPQQFITAIDNEEIEKLSHVPGIGKKTAAKLILALRGKLVTAQQQESSELHPELVSALVDMGFERKKARQAIKELVKTIDSDTLSVHEREHELFRRAIIHLSSGT